MFDFWFDLTTPARVLFSLLLVGIAVGIFFLSGGTRVAIGLGVTGLVLLLFSGSGGNKGGYNF